MSLPPYLQDLNPNIYLSSNNYIVLDFEVAHYGIILEGAAKADPSAMCTATDMLLAVWRMPDDTYKRIWADEYGMQELIYDVQQVDFVVCHASKFELAWLKRCGADVNNILPYCTMLGEYVRAGNRRNIRLDLDTTCKRYGIPGKVSWVSLLIKQGVCPSEIPASDLEKYCVQDVRATHTLFIKQRKVLHERNILAVAFTRNIVTPVLVDIESRGMHIDKNMVAPVYKRVNKAQGKILRLIDTFTGGINPNSYKQVGEYLYDVLGFNELTGRGGKPKRSPAGSRLTDKGTIAALKPTTPEQHKFLRLKTAQAKLHAKLSRALSPLTRCIEETEEHILHANFNQHISRTLRLTSTGKRFKAQLQNIANIYKKLFNSRYKNWLIGDIDSGKLEFVVGAHIYQDKQAIQDILDGRDIHLTTASYYCKKSESKINSEERRANKPSTFRPMFSSGLFGNDIDKAYAKYFKSRYAIMEAGMKAKIYKAYTDNKLVGPTGLISYWTLKKTKKGNYYEGEEQVRNFDIQHLATGDMMQIGITYLYHRTRHLESFMTCVIHDSAVLEVKPEERKELESIGEVAFIEDIIYYMKQVYDIDFTPGLLSAEWKFNTNWTYDKIIINKGTLK